MNKDELQKNQKNLSISGQRDQAYIIETRIEPSRYFIAQLRSTSPK